MKMKRGTDHNWHIIRYVENLDLFAKCKCGFEYDCGNVFHKEKLTIYLYCPNCGARKKWYNPEPDKINSWDN